MPDKPLLSAGEAAKLAGLTRSRFYRLLNEDVIPDAVIRIPGGNMLIRRAALLRWLGVSPVVAEDTEPSAPAEKFAF